jgi:hypothetical protein
MLVSSVVQPRSPDDNYQLLTDLMAISTVGGEPVSRRACWRNTQASQRTRGGDLTNVRFKAHL